MSKAFGQTLLDDMVRSQSLPMPLVKQAAREILAVIREGLIRDGVVKVSNFGTFRLKPVAARKGINPQTGEVITIPARQRVIFSPCKALRDQIQPVHQPPIPIQPVQDAQSNIPEGDNAPATSEQLVEATGSMPLPDTEPPSQASPESPTSQPDGQPTPAQEQVKKSKPAITANTESRTLPENSTVEITANPSPENEKHETAASAAVTAHQYEITVADLPVSAPSTTQAEPEEPTKEATDSSQSHAKTRYVVGAAAILLIAMIGVGLLVDSQQEIEGTNETMVSAEVNGSREIAEPEPMTETGTDEKFTAVETEQPAAETVAEENAAFIQNTTENEPLEEAKTAALKEVSGVLSEDNTDPQDAAAATESTAPAASQASAEYFIEQPHKILNGESLWRLARQHYQDPLLWPHIYQANTTLIDDPDRLFVGRIITIPGLQGSPDNLTKADRRHIAEGYYLTYLHYRRVGREDALFALLEAKRYDNSVVQEHRSLLQLTGVEELKLAQQETMPFLAQ